MRHQPGYFRPSEVMAFAEGRRLREEAEVRRRGHPVRSGSTWPSRPEPQRMVRVRRRALPLIVPAAVAVSLVLAVAGTALAVAGVFVLLTVLPLLVVGMVVTTAVRHSRRAALRRGGAAGTAPLPGRRAAPPRPDLVWQRARSRFHALCTAYAAYECDPMEVLRLPALADVGVGSTARFVDAFAEAQALETESLPPAEHAATFVAAVDRAERAWRAAREAAERIRHSGLTPAERGTVERVLKLLTTARDSDSGPERLAAYARARTELAKLDRAGIVHLPRPAAAALDDAARAELPA